MKIDCKCIKRDGQFAFRDDANWTKSVAEFFDFV